MPKPESLFQLYFLSCWCAGVLGVPMSCVTSVLVCSRELLLYTGLAGGSSLTGQVVAVLNVQTTLFVAAFLAQSLLKKINNSKTHFSSSVGIWLFESVVVWPVGVCSPSSFLGFFTVTVWMCWIFLSSQDGNVLALGHGSVLQLLFQLMLHLVTVHQPLP